MHGTDAGRAEGARSPCAHWLNNFANTLEAAVELGSGRSVPGSVPSRYVIAPEGDRSRWAGHRERKSRTRGRQAHPGLTQDVARNENPKRSEGGDVRNANVRGVVCGALVPVSICKGLVYPDFTQELACRAARRVASSRSRARPVDRAGYADTRRPTPPYEPRARCA